MQNVRSAEWVPFCLLHSNFFLQIGGSPRCCPVLCGLRDRCLRYSANGTYKRKIKKAEFRSVDQWIILALEVGLSSQF